MSVVEPSATWSGPTIAALSVSLAATLIAGSATVVSYLLYRSQADPDVIVYAELDRKRPSLLNLIIRNQGQACAHDVRFAWQGDLPAHAWGIEEASAQMPKPMSEGPLIRGIPFLPPGGTRIITWGQYGGIAKGLSGRTVQIQIKFKSRRRVFGGFRHHMASCPLEIASFEAIDDSDLNWDKKVAENLKELTKSIARESRWWAEKVDSSRPAQELSDLAQAPGAREGERDA